MKRVLLLILLASLPFKVAACILDQKVEGLKNQEIEIRKTLDTPLLEDVETIKQHLSLMVNMDQEARRLLLEDPQNSQICKFIEDIDRFHTNHLKVILTKHPWITISKFGPEADYHAWLLVQHADHDPEFQEHCLSILESLLLSKETNERNYAFLYDRVALKRGLKQRYGTQAKIEGNKIGLFPFEGSLDELNERRKRLGLDSIDIYLETLKKVYN